MMNNWSLQVCLFFQLSLVCLGLPESKKKEKEIYHLQIYFHTTFNAAVNFVIILKVTCIDKLTELKTGGVINMFNDEINKM